MPDADRDDASEKVEVLIPFDVPEVLHRGVVRHEGFLVVVRDRWPEVLPVLAHNLFTAARGCFRWRRHFENPRLQVLCEVYSLPQTPASSPASRVPAGAPQ